MRKLSPIEYIIGFGSGLNSFLNHYLDPTWISLVSTRSLPYKFQPVPILPGTRAHPAATLAFYCFCKVTAPEVGARITMNTQQQLQKTIHFIYKLHIHIKLSFTATATKRSPHYRVAVKNFPGKNGCKVVIIWTLLADKVAEEETG